MVEGSRKVIIEDEAKRQLKEAYNFIKKDSLRNAEKVKIQILESLKDLSKYPEKYAAGKYRTNNDGSFRAYEIYKYRITYKITDKNIIVIRIRHTKMNPVNY